MMNDPAISYSANGNATVDTYSLDGASVGMNDFGEPLYDFDGVTMTAQQAEDNSDYFLADDDYDDGDYYDNETLPDTMIEGLDRINDVLGGGAADFIADELLGIGESRMDEVMAATYMDKAEIHSYANAVMIDLAANVGMNHDMLMDALGEDINTVRSMRSDRGMNELHQIITDAVNGEYHASMTRWNRLRGVLSTLR